MIKVSVLYPNNEGSKFDMSYYCKSHMPMVQQKLGKSCKSVAVEQGVSGAAAGSRPAFVAMGHLYFDSIAAFQSASGRMWRRSWPTSRITRISNQRSRLAKSCSSGAEDYPRPAGTGSPAIFSLTEPR
jgi:uncharacterized protein (TIGR02118 family)